MFCKRCGNALPSHGFVCLNCGAMMSPEQIKEQKELMKKDNNNVILKSDFYSKEPINRNYEKPKDNKIVGALIILIIVIALIVFAILKVM